MFNKRNGNFSGNTIGIIIILITFLITGCGIIGKDVLAPDTIDDTTIVSPAWPILSYKAVVVRVNGDVSENWINAVKPVFMDPQYHAVILWIDSPGGDVITTKIVAHKLEFLKNKYKKRLYIFTEKYLASGAYWVSCVADEIIAAPSAYVGSIGAFIVRVDARKYYEKQGVTLYYIASDSNKVRGNDASEMTEKEREYWQAYVDQIHQEFMAVVWNHRAKPLLASFILLNNIPQKKYTTEEIFEIQRNAQMQFYKIADGTLYNNKDAYLFGLIDRFMYFDELVTMMNNQRYTVYNIAGDTITDLYVKPSKR